MCNKDFHPSNFRNLRKVGGAKPYVHSARASANRDFVCIAYTPTEGTDCLSQGVIQTSNVLGGTVSYFIVSRG